MKVSIYRNLNAAKRDPERFIWSRAIPGTNKKGQLKIGSPGPKPEHVERAFLLAPTDIVKAGKIEKIRREARRDVALWIVGTPAPFSLLPYAEPIPAMDWLNPLTGELHDVRAITCNPLPETRDGRRESCFHFCDVVLGQLVIQKPVDFSRVYGIFFGPHGAAAVMN